MADISRSNPNSFPVVGRTRAYSLDARVDELGDRSLIIREGAVGDSESCERQITIPEWDLIAFASAFRQAAAIVLQDVKTYDVAEIRKEHPQAYRPWSSEDDERLRREWEAGHTLAKLSRSFERNQGAIRSRLVKLGVDPTRPPSLRKMS